jgi:hypothetical protein
LCNSPAKKIIFQKGFLSLPGPIRAKRERIGKKYNFHSRCREGAKNRTSLSREKRKPGRKYDEYLQNRIKTIRKLYDRDRQYVSKLVLERKKPALMSSRKMKV